MNKLPILISFIFLAGCSLRPRIIGEGMDVVLSGSMVRETFPGIPNYESIAAGDQPETCWIFILEKPIRLRHGGMGDSKESYLTDPVVRLQLLIPSQQLYKSYEPYLNQPIAIRGKPFVGHTGHHHCRILFEVLASAILPELEGNNELAHDASTNALIEYFRANR